MGLVTSRTNMALNAMTQDEGGILGHCKEILPKIFILCK
jgi:hypothetical protein